MFTNSTCILVYYVEKFVVQNNFLATEITVKLLTHNVHTSHTLAINIHTCTRNYVGKMYYK